MARRSSMGWRRRDFSNREDLRIATRARVADTATDADLAQILAWVREGEATKD
jgi:hypothetical protein